MIQPRERQVFRALWEEGRLSRSELHERTGLSPNGVGTLAESMLNSGLLRECPAAVEGAGRPRVPLEIDPARRNVIGLALVPGRVELCRLGLAGNVLHQAPPKPVSAPDKLIATASALLGKYVNRQTLGVGMSVTGFVDPVHRTLLFSSATRGGPAANLGPIFDAVPRVPIILENDMHALAARWLLTHRADSNHDVLLVWIDDGRFGAAMLINGRPNRGCAIGGNELGHTRFPVETPRCFCGQKGCLERIVSTEFLAMRDDQLKINSKSLGSLQERAARFEEAGNDRSLDEMMGYLASSLANAVIFVRPHRLVLVSPFTRSPAFASVLTRLTRGLVLPQLAERVRFDLWDEPGAGSAETAAWLAMAEILHGGWNPAVGEAGVTADAE